MVNILQGFENITGFLATFEQAYHAWIPYSIRLFVWRTKDAYFNPYFLSLTVFLIPFVFFLEKVNPARPEQRVFSVGLFQDFLWFNLGFVARTTLVASFYFFLSLFFIRHLNFLTIEAVQGWPMTVRAVVSYLFADFLAWFHHFVRHKVKPLWFFHTVHHSQREINFFTEGRVHVMEYLVASLLIFIPSHIMQVDISIILWLPVFHEWYKHIYHANLKTNYGPLKHFMVTPQSHRIHHSVKPEHRDKNLGVIFTFWDRIFGTLYKNYDEYPETGIEDSRFPVENRGGIFVVPNFFKQFIYPFRLMFQREAVAQNV